jgi:hypothetical protein
VILVYLICLEQISYIIEQLNLLLQYQIVLRVIIKLLRLKVTHGKFVNCALEPDYNLCNVLLRILSRFTSPSQFESIQELKTGFGQC